MRIFEPGDPEGWILHHRTVKIPYFFHTVLLSPYIRKSTSRVTLDPLEKVLIPPSGDALYHVVPEDQVMNLSRQIHNEVVYIPSVPCEDTLYGRVKILAESLLSRNNAVLALVEGPPYPKLPDGVTPVISLLSLFSGHASMDLILRSFGNDQVSVNPLFLYPILPGLSDRGALSSVLEQLKREIPECSVVPVQPLLNRAVTDFILEKVDSGKGDAGRAYDILFQTARSVVDERLLDHYYEVSSGLGISGLVPLHMSDPGIEENFMISQRALLLWHTLLYRGEEDLAWAWYRAGQRIREIHYPLSTLVREDNLALLDLDQRVLLSIISLFQGESALLSPEESCWLPV